MSKISTKTRRELVATIRDRYQLVIRSAVIAGGRARRCALVEVGWLAAELGGVLLVELSLTAWSPGRRRSPARSSLPACSWSSSPSAAADHQVGGLVTWSAASHQVGGDRWRGRVGIDRQASASYQKSSRASPSLAWNAQISTFNG